MQDSEYRHAITHYDLETLRQVLDHLDAAQYPDRQAWLKQEIDKRLAGVDATPLQPVAAFRVSRDEVFAGFLYRLPALVIDLLLVYTPLGILFSLLLDVDQAWLVCVLPFAWPAYVIASTVWLGATPGKWLLGLRIVGQGGKASTPAQAIRRHVPDVVLAVLMAAAVAIALLSGFTLPAHGTTVARISAFHHQIPLWDVLDDIWDLWLWSEILLLCLDDRRRSLMEFFSGTLVVHDAMRGHIEHAGPFERSWFDWLESLVRRATPPAFQPRNGSL